MGGGAERSRRLSKSCVLLIVIAGMERFAFKGVVSNLVTYLTDIVGLSNSSAAKMVNSWFGLTSIMPLLVAPLVDSYWNRYSTILTCSMVYLLGLVALTSTASDKTTSSSFLFWSLCLISIGLGGCNPSLQAFGTDQLESCEAQDHLPETTTKPDQTKSTKKSFFFRMWYFGVCTGSLLGVTVMSCIQDNFGWVLGFAIPTLAMFASIVLFLCGTGIYAYKEGREVENSRPVERIVRAIKEVGLRLKKGGVTLDHGRSDHAIELELEEKPLCHEQASEKEDQNSMTKKPVLVSNTRILLNLLPIWTTLLMFAVIFQQPATFFTKQGMTMRRTFLNLKLPPAALQSSITISIILLMPLYDSLLVPLLARLLASPPSLMHRMGAGMALSALSMSLAAISESSRLRTLDELGQSRLSILWLLPQYVVLGIADVFTVVGMQEFFYGEVPVGMRTTGFALYTSVFGVGSFLSAVLIWVVEGVTGDGGGRGWFSDDMREARLDRYYWLLAVMSVASLGLYVVFCKCYRTRAEMMDGDHDEDGV